MKPANWKKALLYTVVGGAAGFAVAFAYSYLGST
jgi:hypothetical protein